MNVKTVSILNSPAATLLFIKKNDVASVYAENAAGAALVSLLEVLASGE